MITELVIIALTISILVWDLYLYNDKIEGNSISQVVIKWSSKYPLIPFVMGLLIGHFYA